LFSDIANFSTLRQFLITLFPDRFVIFTDLEVHKKTAVPVEWNYR